jgi:hypothetical protein
MINDTAAEKDFYTAISTEAERTARPNTSYRTSRAMPHVRSAASWLPPSGCSRRSAVAVQWQRAAAGD